MTNKNSCEYFCKTFKHFVEISQTPPTKEQWEGIKNALENVEIPKEDAPLINSDKLANVFDSFSTKLKETKDKIEKHLKDE